MWFVVALLLLTPVVWALAGAPAVPALDTWVAQHVPDLAAGATASAGVLMTAALVGTMLGAGRARATSVHVSTLAHELGHGLAAALLGGRIDRIRTHRDGSGVAYTAMPGHRPVRRFVVSAAGYVTPGVLALASMRAATAGVAALWVTYLVAVVAVMLVLAIRSWWGLLVSLALSVCGWALVVLAPELAVVCLVAALAGLLAGAGTVDAWQQWRFRGTGMDSDAHAMAIQTRLPVGLFAGLHLAVAVGLTGAAISAPAWA